ATPGSWRRAWGGGAPGGSTPGPRTDESSRRTPGAPTCPGEAGDPGRTGGANDMMGGHHAISGAAAWLALTGSVTIGDRALGAGVLDLTGPEVLAGTVEIGRAHV